MKHPIIHPVIRANPVEIVRSDDESFILAIYDDGGIYLFDKDKDLVISMPMHRLKNLNNMISAYLGHMDRSGDDDDDDVPF